MDEIVKSIKGTETNPFISKDSSQALLVRVPKIFGEPKPRLSLSPEDI